MSESGHAAKRQSSERFAALDVLRALACICVLLYHYLWWGPSDGRMEAVGVPMLAAIARYGYLGVHLFFMISGFVILMTALHATPSVFVASRVARLYPALWAAASVTAATVWFFQNASLMVSPSSFVVNLSMLAPVFKVPLVDGSYWTLDIELRFYFMVWLVLRFGLLRHLDVILGLWLLISAINYLRPMYPVEVWLLAKWAPLFAGGCLLLKSRMTGFGAARCSLLAIACLLAMLYAVRTAGEDVIQAQAAGVAIFLMFGMFTAIAASRWQLRSSCLTTWLGTMTYPVYLVHQYFGYVLHQQLVLRGFGPVAALFFVIALVLILSWFIHREIEMRLGPKLKLWVLKTAGHANGRRLSASTNG